MSRVARSSMRERYTRILSPIRTFSRASTRGGSPVSAVRFCEKTMVGPPQQHLPAIDDKGVGDGWDLDPIAGLGAECDTGYVVGGSSARPAPGSPPQLRPS